MATSDPQYQLLFAQVHIPMCEKHGLTIDMACEDCDVFICSQCAKTDHKDHDWTTLSTAGSLRRRELKNTLSKVKEKDIKEMEEKIKKASKQMEDNQKCSDSEVSKLQKHYDEILSKLDGFKQHFDTKLRENFERKNSEVSRVKFDLEKKKKQIDDLLKFLEDKHNTMSDYSLIDNLRDLRSLVSYRDSDIKKLDCSMRYRRGDISEGILESMMGQTFDLDDLTVTETDSFQYGDRSILVIEAIKEDRCFVEGLNSSYIEEVNKTNESKKKFNINVYDACIINNGDVYATDYEKRHIVRLSPSGSVSTVFNTYPLTPGGICQSTEGLLVTLRDTLSENYKPGPQSRRLVRHLTPTGDVLRKYEYREDGHTKLFTLPRRVKQNSNTDICVVNWTSKTTGELVILYLSGLLKSVYHGKNQAFHFKPIDVVCDSHCNIIVNDLFNCQVHLLSADVEFMKYLLTENEVTDPYSMSLYKSTLWIGNTHGLVKVFQYYNKN